MNELSKNQLHYLNMHRRHKRIIVVSRISILLTFLFLWEFSANTGLIDSFIFSSPSRIALCFLEMTGDGSIFRHIGVTLYETLVSFILVIFFSLFVTVLPEAFRNPGALSGGAEQPAKICACSTSHCLARRKPHNNYHCRNVCCNLREHTEPLFRIFRSRPR
mgnify:CR=1 FL=1